MATITDIINKVKKPVTVTDPKVDEAAREKLITARISMLLKAPFFGTIATRMPLVNADSWCPTAATDGRHFYYNSAFVNKMPMRQVEFLVGHETLHAVYDHMGRRNGRHPRIWNFANDYCVNQDLIDQRIGEKITVVNILHDPRFKGMSSEEVYDILISEAEQRQKKSGKGDPGDELSGEILDEHLDPDNLPDEIPEIDEVEAREIRDSLRDAVLQAAAAVGADNVPAGVKRLIQDMTNPVISWQELLEQQIQSVFKDDFTWQKPSRRGWGMDAIMPGMINGHMVEVDIAMDMSGSIGSEEIKAFLSEVKGIIDSFDEYKIRLWCFDTQVYNVQEFTSENGADLLEYQPQGGGGTSFECNWEYMKENEIEPKKFIMFTDGYPGGGWGDPDYCDTVWVIKGNVNAKPPFGVWAIYEHAAAKAKH